MPSMKTTEMVPCVCGKGVLEVEVKDFGRWRVERLLTACASCEQGDIEASREAQLVVHAAPQHLSAG
ncbi:MAG: hypothetical protein Q8K32_31055 [Archangium sp.]|nr:hypothetical protein [Archangium sp.]